MTVTTGPVVLENKEAGSLLIHLLSLLGDIKIIPTGIVGRNGANCLLYKRGMEKECYLSVFIGLPEGGKQNYRIVFQEGQPAGRIAFAPRVWWVIDHVTEIEKEDRLNTLLWLFFERLIEKYGSQDLLECEPPQEFPPSAVTMNRVFAGLV